MNNVMISINIKLDLCPRPGCPTRPPRLRSRPPHSPPPAPAEFPSPAAESSTPQVIAGL